MGYFSILSKHQGIHTIQEYIQYMYLHIFASQCLEAQKNSHSISSDVIGLISPLEPDFQRIGCCCIGLRTTMSLCLLDKGSELPSHILTKS